MNRRAASPSDAERIERRLGDWSVACLSVIGLWIILSPLTGPYTGYTWLCDLLGGEHVLLRVLLGFLFLYFAGIVKEKNALVGALRSFRRAGGRAAGPTGEESRQAVDLLLAGLSSEREEVRRIALENLRRLTGRDLGSDPAAWHRWWKEARDSFAPPPVQRPGEDAS